MKIPRLAFHFLILMVFFAKPCAAESSGRNLSLDEMWSLSNNNKVSFLLACYSYTTDRSVSYIYENVPKEKFETAMINIGGYESISINSIKKCNENIKKKDLFAGNDESFKVASLIIRLAARELDFEIANNCRTDYCKNNAVAKFSQNVNISSD